MSKILKGTLIGVVAVALVAAGVGYYAIGPCLTNEQEEFVYVDADDNLDSVMNKVDAVAHPKTMMGFKALASHGKYGDRIRTGRYTIDPDMTMLQLFRNLRNHQQDPIKLVVPTTRTLADMAGRVTEKLMIDSLSLMQSIADSAVCAKFGLNHQTMPSLFIPNTYQVFWDMSVDDFLERMKKEHDNFWNADRLAKAKAHGLDPQQVATLASIVDSESAYDPEKPRIAGLYLNRLKMGMPLQSDPTVIFAVGDFTIRRVLNVHLNTNSPYNTYKNIGLPPGPIRIASIAGLEAVLNAEKHGYLYMCAKEDFSGSHNFATTFAQHAQNARRYTQALNQRGIMK